LIDAHSWFPLKTKKVFGILDLVGQHQAGTLQRLLAPIDVVTKKQIVGTGRVSSELEDSKHVVVLSVRITDDLDGSCELQLHGLRHEDIAGSETDELDLGLGEVDTLSWPRTSDA